MSVTQFGGVDISRFTHCVGVDIPHAYAILFENWVFPMAGASSGIESKLDRQHTPGRINAC